MIENDYFYKTSFFSEIAEKVYDDKDSYEWFSGKLNNQFQVKDFDQNLIYADSLLNFLHPHLNGVLRFFKFPSMTFYNWHIDSDNKFNLNLIFRPQESYTVFRNKEEHAVKDDEHAALKTIKVADYQPLKWTLFNAQIAHTIFNVDPDTRFLLTYNIKKWNTKLSYLDTLDLIKEFESKNSIK